MKLVVHRCSQCRQLFTRPRNICSECGNTVFDEEILPGKGQIFSFTTIYKPPEGYHEQVPYTVIVVELTDEQPTRIIARLSPGKEDKLAIGANVVLEKVNKYGYFFSISS